MADLNERLTATIEAGSFESAPQLVEQLGAALQLRLQTAPPSDLVPTFEAALGQLRAQLELAQVVRSHLASYLTSVLSESLYSATVSEQHTWSYEG